MMSLKQSASDQASTSKGHKDFKLRNIDEKMISKKNINMESIYDMILQL